MRKIIYRFVCIALCLLTAQSCNNWLDVQPTDRQTEAQTYSSVSGFYSVLNGIYTKMNTKYSYGEHLSYNMIEILAKRFVIAGTKNEVGTAFQQYTYSDKKAKEVIQKIWETNYNIILNCNIVLANAELKKDMLGEKDYSIIKGEMLAVRAFIHFDMLRLFGPVYLIKPDAAAIPYNTSPNGEVSPILTAKEVIFEHILVDIKDSETLLAKHDPVLTDGPMSDKIEDDLSIYSDSNIYKYRQLRFNYYALLTLKARVQLYAGEKEGALATAKSVINSENVAKYFPPVTSESVVGNINPDRMFTSESFFGMYKKDRNLIYKESFDPETAGSSLLQPKSGYVESTLFRGMASDYRLRSHWGISATSGNAARVFLKYKDVVDKLFFHATYVPLVRLSEMYLIAAETEPIVADGLVHLNKLRVQMRGNIGLPLTGIVSPVALNTQINMEYIREFYGEGQLFYYYKRLNTPVLRGDLLGGSTEYLVGISTYYVLPLPESETMPR